MTASPEHNESRDLLRDALAQRATDVHIDPLRDGFRVRLRIDGRLSTLRDEKAEAGERLINQFKAAAGIEPGAVFTPRGVRRSFEIDGRRIDCRITLAPCLSGPKISLRLLDPALVLTSVDELGLGHAELEAMRRWLSELNGMVLVSGPTASGKTTTLYALLHELAETRRHIVTIEDPAEYEIDGINQIQVDHRHGLGFTEGVKTILRMDPDHAMIGELREAEAARAAVGAAVAGHVVLTCLHARDAVSSVTTLRHFGIPNHHVAAALGVVVNQRLVRKLCPDCRGRASLDEAAAARFRAEGVDPPERTWVSAGCEACGGSGFRGRTGLFEVWHLDEVDYEMILAGADEETLRDKLAREGHVTLWRSAAALIDEGVTSFEEVRQLGLKLPWR